MISFIERRRLCRKVSLKSSKQFVSFRFLFLIWVGLFSVLLAGCADGLPACEDEIGCVTIRPNEPIQLAYFLPLTGPAAELGESISRGIEMGREQIDNTILGHTLNIQAFDSGCSIATSQRVAERLVQEQDVVAIIGPACSDVADEVVPAVHATGGVMVSPATTAVSLDNFNDTATSFFRVIPSHAEQAQVAAEFASDFLNAQTAVILYEQTPQSVEQRDQFVDTFQQSGGAIVEQGDIRLEEDELIQLLNELIDLEPDLIFLPLQASEANYILNKLVEINTPQSIVKIGTSALYNAEFPVLTGSAAESLYVTGFVGNGVSYNIWLEQWRAFYDLPPETAYPVYASDAVLLIAQAIESVAISDGQGSLLIGRQALRDALAENTPFSGVTGILSCSSLGECRDLESIGIYQINDDQIDATVWPPLLISR